jgi:hypothetical protein
MKLYEINAEILRLTDAIEFDPETGEILGSAEDLFDEVGKLQMQKKSILVWLAKLVLNLRSEEAALKAEEDRLKARRTRLAKKEDQADAGARPRVRRREDRPRDCHLLLSEDLPSRSGPIPRRQSAGSGATSSRTATGSRHQRSPRPRSRSSLGSGDQGAGMSASVDDYSCSVSDKEDIDVLNITTWKNRDRAHRTVVIYGPEGIGKTTLAAQIPDPMCHRHRGRHRLHLDVRRIQKPGSLGGAAFGHQGGRSHAWISARPSFIDTADWAEQLAIDHLPLQEVQPALDRELSATARATRTSGRGVRPASLRSAIQVIAAGNQRRRSPPMPRCASSSSRTRWEPTTAGK